MKTSAASGGFKLQCIAIVTFPSGYIQCQLHASSRELIFIALNMSSPNIPGPRVRCRWVDTTSWIDSWSSSRRHWSSD